KEAADNSDSEDNSASPFKAVISRNGLNDSSKREQCKTKVEWPLHMQSVWSILGLPRNPVVPWYKGSNVCIKREEEDEIVEADPASTDVTPAPTEEDLLDYNLNQAMYPKDEPFTESFNQTELTNPEWHMKLSYCKDMDTKRACFMKLYGPRIKRTISVAYECCHGYELDSRKEKCERTRYENAAKTIQDIGGTEFLTLITNIGLLNKIRNENITIFVPSNEAVASYLTSNAVDSNSIDFIIEPESARRKRGIIFHRTNNPQGRDIRRHNIQHHNRQNEVQSDGDQEWPQASSEEFDMNDIDWKRNALDQHEAHKRTYAYEHEESQSKLEKALLGHMLEGRISTDDFVDEKVVFSENRDSVIRMNTWNIGNERVKTVNCARLTSINHKCSNGMVHMIDRMFKPVSRSISDVIGGDPELSLLNTLFASSGLMPMLSDKNQHLTLFAPTNAAINKLGHAILHKMQHGDPCLKRILRRHILPITFCSSIVYKQGQVRNIDGDVMDIDRVADDKLFLNGSQIVIRDIVTTNGVVHVIDAVVMSDQDQPLSKALENGGYRYFLDAVRSAGLEDYIDELNNVTLFVPTNDAMEELGQDILRNPSKLREILLYHIATPETKTCGLSHEQVLPTKLHNRNIHINLYSHFPIDLETEVTAQCGRLTMRNKMACNGIMHEVDRILLPSEHDLLETLKSQPDFTIFYRLLIQSGFADQMRRKNVSTTIFAPTDSAFYALPKEDFRKLLNDTVNASKIVQNHIIEEPLCCAGVAPNNWFMTRNVDCINGAKVPVYRDTSGRVRYGSATVTTCDLTASNGIIHTIDKVLNQSNDLSRGDLMESCFPDPFTTIRSATFFIRL
ncbi:Transforming growth factor-beta-induced protein ig-h3, partial [Orchesella cincta]